MAVRSQCIHCTSTAFWERKYDGTSKNGLGTKERACHQNWMMGFNGVKQMVARRGLNSHDACMQFYIASFDHAFKAMPKIRASNDPMVPRDAERWRNGFSMGYMQRDQPETTGEIVAL